MGSCHLLDSLHLRGFLSFGPGSEPVKLQGLNVLIGPNGVGKSNLIEAVELLHATPTNFSSAIRVGGLPSNWIWRSGSGNSSACVDTVLSETPEQPALRYGIEFTEVSGRTEITGEVLENTEITEEDHPEQIDVSFYYRLMQGHSIINAVQPSGHLRRNLRVLKREDINPGQSILSQMKDPGTYPELHRTGERFERIRLFREWEFGRNTVLRKPQPADLPADVLLPNLTNLGLVLADWLHRGGEKWNRFNELMRRFLPRYERFSTTPSTGSIQMFLHEEGLSAPVPATRLSDGTLRFLALLTILLNTEASLICIEEPDVGLHPDAMAILAELLVETSARTQVIVTTHSDTLVSELTDHAESVLVCDYGREGTELRRLEFDKLHYWLEKYRLGEMWRLGEVGGNP